MILPLAVFYDNNGDPTMIRYLQFTMRQDVAADFTWEYYNSIITTPYSTLDMLEHRVLDIPFAEARANAGRLSLLTGKYWGNNYCLGEVQGVTSVRADGSLEDDWLQVIAVKRPANRQGTMSIAVVSHEKLLTGIVEVLVVDYKGNIKRYNFDAVLELAKQYKIKLGNVRHDGKLSVWSQVQLVRKIACASEEIRNGRSDMLNVAELSGQVDHSYYGDDLRDRMGMVLPATESVIIPNGWLSVKSDKNHMGIVKQIVCPDYMITVDLEESRLKGFRAPIHCCNFRLKGTSSLEELYLPKSLSIHTLDEGNEYRNKVKPTDSTHTEFTLCADVIPSDVIDQSEYYDLSKYTLQVNTAAPNLQAMKIAQPRITESSASSFGLGAARFRYIWETHTRVSLRNPTALKHMVFLKPKYSDNRYRATSNTAQEIELTNACALERIQIEGKSLKTYIKLEQMSGIFTLEAHAIRTLQFDLPKSADITIRCRIKYLGEVEVCLERGRVTLPHTKGSAFIEEIRVSKGKVKVVTIGGGE